MIRRFIIINIDLLKRSIHTLLTLLIVVTLSPTLSAEEVIDSICAIVDEEIILESEVSYGIHTLLLESGERFPSPAKLSELRQQVLKAYITQKILIAKAVEETLRVEERKVNKELERKLEGMTQQLGSREKLVEYFGRPLRQIKREMKKGVEDGLLIDILRQQKMMGIQVRRPEVIEFYNEYVEEMPTLPERVALSHILLAVESSEAAVRETEERMDGIYELLKAGADFDSVAIEHSDDPSSSNGGRLGFTEQNDLVPEYEEVAYQLEPGAISGIVKSRYGLHIIRLIERQGERISTQHILVKLTPNEDDWKRAIAHGMDIRERILKGEKFDEMARQNSTDAESAPKGGKLAEMAVDDLPVEFKNIVETMDTGDISEPFETSFV